MKLFLQSYALEVRTRMEGRLTGEMRLERLRSFLKHLGDPQEQFKTIHVAGTTGKGSTCAYSEALLRTHGFKTGLSVSPHVSDVRERFQLNGALIDEGQLKHLLSRLIPIVQLMEQEPAGAPGYMEFVRALSYRLFADECVDYAIVETGVGGLLDSSNTISRPDKFCVITKLGLDHVRTLGETIEQIAQQKLGIVQPGNRVLIGVQEDIPQSALEDMAQRAGAIEVRSVTTQATYLRQNAELAIEACRRIAIRDNWVFDEQQAQRVVSELSLPLRFERILWNGKTLVLDAAHNPQKMRGLAQALRTAFQQTSFAVALAFNPGTDVEGTATPFFATQQRIACVDVLGGEGNYQFHFSQPEEIAKHLRQASSYDQPIDCLSDWSALLAWIDRIPEQVIVLTGSFHFAATVRERLGLSQTE